MRDLPLIAITAFAIALISAPAAHGNPTGQQPSRALAAHGTIEGSKELVEKLYKIYEEDEKFIIETYAKKDTPEKFSDRQIAKAYGRLWLAKRQAQHLQLMGEPAGDDLEKKLSMAFVGVGRFGLPYRGTRRGTQLVQKIKNNLDRRKKSMEKFVQQAQGALKAGKLEIFEKQMEIKGVELWEQFVFLTPEEIQRYQQPFVGVLAQGDEMLQKKRKAEYMKRANEVMTQHVAAAMAFPSEASRIRDEIASTGTAKLDGEKTGGPAEAFAHVANLWGKASAGLLRASAIQWAFTRRGTSNVQPSPSEFRKMAINSLASIIEAAAVSTPPQNVGPVYSDLLQQITVIQRRISPTSTEVSEGCKAALEKLAAKDPALPARLAAYERATSQPLRWRKLYAKQQATNLEKQFPEATRYLNAEVPATEGVRPNFHRGRVTKTRAATPMFGEPANWMVQEAANHIVGKPIREKRMVRISPTSRTAIVPFEASHYGNLPAAMPSEAEVDDLKSALVIDDTHGPLSIDSANAVSAADLHDYVTVSGVVENVHLESLVTRFIALPDAAYAIQGLGRIPSVGDTYPPNQLTCWRFDLKPMWAQHDYFTVRVRSKTQ